MDTGSGFFIHCILKGKHMTSIFVANSLGLVNTLLNPADGQKGNAQTGRSGEGVYVNAATGNLVVQRQDEILVGRGLNANVLNTYNSQAQMDGDNNDNWRIGFYRQVSDLLGKVNTAGSKLTRTDADGARQTFTWDGEKYVCRDGAGSYDTLVFNASAGRWTWTDGDSRVSETYDWSGGRGNLISQADANGNTMSFIYSSGLLRQVMTSTGESVFLDYSGINLTQIRTIDSANSSLTRVRYAYDTSNRLRTVEVDLTPQDNSIGDGNTYVTTYTYEGASTRIATLVQSDGTSLSFTYLNGKVASITDALNNLTRYSYVVLDDGVNQTFYTDVTDPLNNITRYEYDASQNLTKITGPAINGVSAVQAFAYNTNGDVSSTTDAEGRTTTFEYDTRGNQILQTDALGNKVVRDFNAQNQLLSETITVQGNALATRYVYDAAGKKLLRFVISPEGRVTEHKYNGFGQRTSTITYSGANAYTASAFAESDLAAWVATTANKSLSERTDMTYDFRGQLRTSSTYHLVSSKGDGIVDAATATTTYVYDQRGNLLNIIAPLDGTAQGASYAYDGLGRVLTRTNALSETTRYQYSDAVANNQTVTTLIAANGLRTVSVYDRAGRLISVMRSNAANANLGTTRYFYDKNDQLRMTQTLSSAQDSTGVSTWVFHDNAGRKQGELDGNGSLTEYFYDKNNQLTQTVVYANPAVNPGSLALDANGNPTASSLASTIASVRPSAHVNDQKTWNAYDALGRLLKTVVTQATVSVNGVSRVDGAVTENEYDRAGRVIKTTRYANTIDTSGLAAQVSAGSISPTADSANDRVTRFFYDRDGLLRATLDEEGFLAETFYNAAGKEWKTIRYATATTEANRANGSLDQLRPLQHANDQTSCKLYNARGETVGEVSNTGYLTEYIYDNNGNLTQKKSYSAPIASPVNATSTLASIRPASSYQLTATSYDALNRIATQTDATGIQTRYEYDTAGNVVRITKAWTAPDARVQTRRYDVRGRLTGELDGVGSSQLAALGPAPTQQQIDAVYTVHGTTYVHDDADRLLSSRDPKGNLTRYYYNADGDLVYEINALGEVKSTTYNVLGQVSSETSHAGRIAASVLATLTGGLVNGAVTAAIDGIANPAADTTTRYAYTQSGALLSSIDALGNTTAYQYNAFAEETLVNKAGRVETTAYNRKGQVSHQAVDPGGANSITNYQYDFLGRKLSTIEAFGTTAARTTTFEYADAQQRMEQRIDPNGLNIRFRFTYDRDGNVLNKTQFSDGEESENRITRYVYDDAGRVRFTLAPEGSIAETRYDSEGRVVRTIQYATPMDTLDPSIVSPGIGELQDFIGIYAQSAADIHQRNYYDRNGRLTYVVDGVGAVTKYSYDSSGNLVEQIAYADPISLDSDPANVPVNPARDQVTRNIYDAANRLVRTIDATGAVTSFDYDAKGNLSRQVAHANSLTRTVVVRAKADNYLGSPTMELWLNGSRVASQSVSNTWYQDYIFNLNWPVGGAADFDIVFSNDYADFFGGDRNLYVDRVLIDNLIYQPTDAAYDLGGNGLSQAGAFDGVNVIAGQALIDRNGALRFKIQTSSLLDAGSIGTIQSSTADRITSYLYNSANQRIYAIDAVGAVTRYDYDANGNVVRETAYANRLDSGKSMKLPSLQNGAYQPVGGVALGSFNACDTVTMTAYFRGDNDRVAGKIQMDGYVNGNYATSYGSATVYSNGDWQKLVVTITLSQNMSLLAWIMGDAGAFKPAGSAGYYDNVVVTSVQRGVVLNERFETAPWWNRGTLDQTMPAVRPADIADLQAMLVTDFSRDRVKRNVYDGAGRLAYEIDAEGYVTAYGYDALGNVTTLSRYAEKITDAIRANWPVAGLTPAAVQQSINTTHTGNRTIARFYNGAGMVERIVLPETYVSADGVNGSLKSPVTRYTYNAFGEVENTQEQRVDGSWINTYYYYNRRGLETARIEGAATTDAGVLTEWGYLTEQSYDAFGNVRQRIEYANRTLSDGADYYWYPSVRGVNDRTWEYTYDQNNRKRTETRLNVAYNDIGVNASNQITLGNRSGSLQNTYEYDAFGNQIRMTDAVNNSTRSYYDQANRIRAIAEPARAIRTVQGDLVIQDTPDFIPLTEFVRNPFGEITQQIERLGSATNLSAYSYSVSSNANDRIRQIVYDNAGNAIQSIDPIGNSEYKSYDAMGQLVRQWQFLPSTNRQVYTEFNYDRKGQLTSTWQPASIQATGGYAGTAYSSEASPAEMGLGTGRYDLRYFTMDFQVGFDSGSIAANDRIARLALNPGYYAILYEDLAYKGRSVLVTGATDLQTVDFSNQASSMIILSANTQDSIKKTQFRYNAFGELVAKGVDGFDGGYSEYYHIDNNGRVWRTNSGDGVNRVMLYDLQGNLTADIRSSTTDLTTAASASQANTLTNLQRARNRYDELGRLTRQDLKNGSVINQDFDRWGNITRVNAAGNVSAVTEYAYNHNNQVISETKPSELLFNYSAAPGANTSYTSQRPVTLHYYDYAGNRIAVRDARNNINGWEYDSAGNVTREIHADGGIVTRKYNGFGDETSRTTDITDNQNSYFYYDKLGRLTAAARPTADFSQISDWAFDESAPVTGYHGENQSGSLKYYWAGEHQYNSSSDKVNYDILQWTRSLGISSGYTATAIGDNGTTDTLSSSRNLITGVYDDVNRIRVTGANSHPVQSTGRGAVTWINKNYDELGRNFRTRNEAQNQLNYSYDMQGNIAVSSIAGVETKAIYDVNGRKVLEVDANNNVESWTYDYFGRLTQRVDLGGAVYDFTYNKLQQLERETSSAGREVTYSYFASGNGTGQVQQMVEKLSPTARRTTTYTYDQAGRRASEKVEILDDLGSLSQTNEFSFDNLGQLKRVLRKDGELINRSLEYKYDAVGNRMYSREDFGGGFVGDWRTSYFAYDAMNRQTLVDGTVDNANGSWNLTESRGFRIDYDRDGNRIRETSGSGGWRQIDYRYDFLGRLIETERFTYTYSNGVENRNSNGKLRRWYDKADRLVAVELDGNKIQVSRYNSKGQLDAQAVVLTDYGYGVESLTSNTYDSAGNLKTAVSRGTGYISTTNYTYGRMGENYKQTSIETIQRVRQPNHFEWGSNTGQVDTPPGRTDLIYYFDGSLAMVNDTQSVAKTRFFRSDSTGTAIEKRMFPFSSVEASNLAVNGQVLGTWGSGQRDFVAYQAIDADFASGGRNIYQVRAGDTLRTIASTVFGDAQMWYLIADANAISDANLRVGQTLLIPNQIATIRNNAGTFEPYNVARFIGDTMPTVPGPAPWQPSQCQQIGVMVAAVVASIVIAAAATAATVFTLGTAAVAAYPAAGILISALIGAAAGAAASMASQGIMIAGRMQSEMNWADVGISAGVGFATGMFSGAMGIAASRAASAAKIAQSAGQAAKESKTMLFFGASFKSALNAKKTGDVVAYSRQLKYLRGRMLLEGSFNAVMDAGSQGVKLAIGQQEKFDWKQFGMAFGSGLMSGASPHQEAAELAWNMKYVPSKFKMLIQKSRINGNSAAVALASRTAIGGTFGALAGMAYDASQQFLDIHSGKMKSWDWNRFGASSAIGASAGALHLGAGVAGRLNEKTSLELGLFRKLITSSALLGHSALSYGVNSTSFMTRLADLNGTLLRSGLGGASRLKTRAKLAAETNSQQAVSPNSAPKMNSLSIKLVAEDEAVDDERMARDVADFAKIESSLAEEKLRRVDFQYGYYSNGVSITRTPEPSIRNLL